MNVLPSALHDETERRYASLYAAVPFGLVLTRVADQTVVAVNDAFLELFACRREDIIGKNSVTAGLLTPAEREGLVARLEAEGRVRDYELERTRGRAQPQVLSVNIDLLTFDEQPMMLSTLRDITREWTERRRLVESEGRYHQAQKLESIGRLAGGVAHDFNNLLTVILSCSENLQLDLADGRAPDPEDVKEIALAGQRAQELTRQLLAFARRQFIEPVDLSLNAVVESSQKMLGRLVGEDVRLESELSPDLWRTWADRGQLEQVLVNLAVNARDAMPRGGTLRFKTENRTQDGEWVVLSVTDTGHGMSDDVKAHLFEPFFTTKPQGKGTGLGLATVYGIVSGAGGQVLVRSAPGEGTTIEIVLPRTQRTAEPRKAPPRSASNRGSEVVLVVEDEPQVREVTLRTLRGAGYEVLGAQGPAEALALPAETLARVQLLVTDVVMPELDGRALADQLRAKNPALRVLFVSGYARDAIADRGVLEPGLDLLAKPFSAASLLTRVRTALDG